jgi:SPP1 family phage portal protein
MYPTTSTETERLIKIINDNKPTTTQIIKEYIDRHNTAPMKEGVRYYFNQNNILNRKQYYWKDGVRIEDEEKPNNRIPHGWHKLLVDQKTSYLAGQPITISGDDKTLVEKVNEILGDEFDDIMPELVKNASNKGREWLHVYIDEDGKFDYLIIPAEEVIPIYDNTKRKNLDAVIRYYELDDGHMKIELWDKETVTYYELIDGEVVMDALVEVNPAPHFLYIQNEKSTGYGWGEVPFIEFKNNEEAVSDLTFYKQLIDAFDKVVSDVSNNLEEIQSLIYVLKGYEGQSLSEFMENLKRYKAISVEADPGSGVDTIQAEVPIASVDSHLNRLEESIFTFGQGVNTNSDKFGNAPSGISLKFLFSLLDMKANWLERKFTKGLYWLFWFVTEYLKMTNQVPNTADYRKLKVTFNKSMLVNEMEQVQIAAQSKGIISDETVLANHPWVEDVEEEKKRIEEERDAFAVSLPTGTLLEE